MTSVVHYGSLTLPRSAQADFDRAVAYLARDPGERRLFARLEGAVLTHRLVIDRHAGDFYDPQTRTIHWDPHSALQTTGGARQSPALGLAHETDHAVENPAVAARLVAQAVRGYDNAEERRVILGSERHAAQILGEGVRHDHRGSVYRVDSPVAMALA